MTGFQSHRRQNTHSLSKSVTYKYLLGKIISKSFIAQSVSYITGNKNLKSFNSSSEITPYR